MKCKQEQKNKREDAFLSYIEFQCLKNTAFWLPTRVVA